MSRSRLAEREPWRVLVTREEGAEGPLSRALEADGFVPVACPVMTERPPEKPERLERAARDLARYDWIVCSSARAVRALCRVRKEPWPKGLRSAAVGEQTALALLAMGADPKPIVAEVAGAQALWLELSKQGVWSGRRVLIPTVPQGRQDLIQSLRAARAKVDVVETYCMRPMDCGVVEDCFARAKADAAVFASPSAALAVFAAVGIEALADLRTIVAIGATTAGTLKSLGLDAVVPTRTGFRHVARCLSEVRAAAAGR